MRIVTWNCNSSPSIKQAMKAAETHAKKNACISKLQPDIAVLQEIPKPLASNSNFLHWSGKSLTRGISVLANHGYWLEDIRHIKTASVSAVLVCGVQSFNLLAVWSRPSKGTSFSDYVREVMDGIATVDRQLRRAPSVVVGDFNSNSKWDKQAGTHNHSALVRLLDDMYGLVSSYHHFYDEPQGAEERSTFYQYRNVSKGFHIDYCFIPREWTVTRVMVGAYEDWIRFSDHMPLIVDVTC